MSKCQVDFGQTFSTVCCHTSRSRLSRSPGSSRLPQTNINLRSLYTAYSKEGRVREIAFLRATSEDITDVRPHVLEEASRSLSNVLISAGKGNGCFARLLLNRVECDLFETCENLRFQNRLISNVICALAMINLDTSPEGVTARETVLACLCEPHLHQRQILKFFSSWGHNFYILVSFMVPNVALQRPFQGLSEKYTHTPPPLGDTHLAPWWQNGKMALVRCLDPPEVHIYIYIYIYIYISIYLYIYISSAFSRGPAQMRRYSP